MSPYALPQSVFNARCHAVCMQKVLAQLLRQEGCLCACLSTQGSVSPAAVLGDAELHTTRAGCFPTVWFLVSFLDGSTKLPVFHLK